jgi:hypothetical protein
MAMLRTPAVFLAGAAILLWTGIPQERGARPLPVLASADFESGRAEGWRPNDPARWSVVPMGGNLVYALTAPGEQGKVRAPTSWSLWSDHAVTSFEFAGRLQCGADPAIPQRDMCVIFGFQDETHFYYAHFAASSDDFHNIIAVVNGADRARINLEPAGSSAARLTDKNWHAFKVTFDAASGDIKAYLDDMAVPVLTARDRTFARGLVGVGSFDDTGFFDDLTLRGVAPRPPNPGAK